MPLMSQARVYRDVNKTKPKEYSNYENFTIEWGNFEDYQLVQLVGCGSFSNVFEAINTTKQEDCVVKILRPVPIEKIKREIKILLNLRGGVNIVNFLEAVKIPSGNTALVFEYMNCVNLEQVRCQMITRYDIRFYTLELLKALDYCHSMGIMHRDIKPQNVIVNKAKRLLRLIDFGISEFYYPKRLYPTNVVSRFFRSPELLIDYAMYDYSIDIWAFGCIFASMIFQRSYIFAGSDDNNQMLSIIKILGFDEFDKYLQKYCTNITVSMRQILDTKCERIPWIQFKNVGNQHYITNESIDLVDKLLCYDHAERLTAAEAMQHAYFTTE